MLAFIECFTCTVTCGPHYSPLHWILLLSPLFCTWENSGIKKWSSLSKVTEFEGSSGVQSRVWCQRLAPRTMTPQRHWPAGASRLLFEKDGHADTGSQRLGAQRREEASVTHCSLRNPGKVTSSGGGNAWALRGPWWPQIPKGGLGAPSSNFPGTSEQEMTPKPGWSSGPENVGSRSGKEQG